MKQKLWTVMQADHDLVFDLINQLTGGSGQPEGSPEEHRRIARQLVALGSVHEVAEELVIWPEVRRRCKDGDELVLEATSQERQAKRALNELNTINAGTIEFDECVDTVASEARSHITYEQNQVWPRLEDHLSDDDAERLARLYLEARRRAPTRPHPHTPPVPAVLGAVGPFVAGLDRMRDMLTGRKVPAPRQEV
jgi:hemerythrin superfamily protein